MERGKKVLKTEISTDFSGWLKETVLSYFSYLVKMFIL